MEAKNAETQDDKTKSSVYTEEEIFALMDFALTVSSPDWSYLGRIKV
jgi:hypothetical protein